MEYTREFFIHVHLDTNKRTVERRFLGSEYDDVQDLLEDLKEYVEGLFGSEGEGEGECPWGGEGVDGK